MTYEPELTTSGEIAVFSDGIPIAQTAEQVREIFRVIEKYGVSTFIELGVYLGGLTNVMLKFKQVDKDFKYYGFEINESQILESMRGKQEVTIIDVFSQNCLDIVKQRVDESVGAALIFCDDGNKSKEAEVYSPLLRVGDLLMAHDYPGEIPDEFLDRFNSEHLNFEEIWHTHFRVEKGAALWRRVR